MRNGKYGTRGTTGNEESASCSSRYGLKVPNPSLSPPSKNQYNSLILPAMNLF